MTERPTVLIADDDPDILELVSFRLRRMGCEPLLARDGDEAYRLATQQVPSVAVLDVMMPGLDGFELTRRLRGHELTAGMPILLLTAKSQDQDVTEGFRSGIDDYVRKPFSPQELRARIQALLDRPARREAATVPVQ